MFLAGSGWADGLGEIKASYFLPTGALFREIYGGGGLYEGEFTYRIWRWVDVWTSAGYFGKSGHAIGAGAETQVFFIPLGVGVKGVYSVGAVDFYGGVGGLGLYLHTRDHSPFVSSTTSQWGGGALFKAGAWVPWRKELFLDLFAQYALAYANGADLSGWAFGAGVGYRWGGM